VELALWHQFASAAWRAEKGVVGDEELIRNAATAGYSAQS